MIPSFLGHFTKDAILGHLKSRDDFLHLHDATRLHQSVLVLMVTSEGAKGTTNCYM
jgi:hypothetical protein